MCVLGVTEHIVKEQLLLRHGQCLFLLTLKAVGELQFFEHIVCWVLSNHSVIDCHLKDLVEYITEVDRPQSTESQTDNRVAEFPASISESDTQTTEVPDQADHSTAVLPQPSEPEKKTDESERRPETAAPTEKEQPTPPATEEPKPVDQPQPTEPPKQEPTEPAFDISYWISFAKSYAESVGLTLNSEAVYCWDNPIDADVGCIYLERDIQSRLNRYAADADITDVWVWYESVSAGSYLIYIGYA